MGGYAIPKVDKETGLLLAQRCKLCHSCKFRGHLGGGTLFCDYLDKTGKLRGEPVSEQCSRYEKGKTPKSKIKLKGSVNGRYE